MVRVAVRLSAERKTLVPPGHFLAFIWTVAAAPTKSRPKRAVGAAVVDAQVFSVKAERSAASKITVYFQPI